MATHARRAEEIDTAACSTAAMVRSDSLIYFPELVRSLGGNAPALFAQSRINPAAVGHQDQLIPYRQMILLLAHSAEELGCSDFGLRLAARQYSEGILGPLDIAMRNSPTIADAWRFCAEHVHIYSPGAKVTVCNTGDASGKAVRFEVLLPRMYRIRQAVEHALLMSHLATHMLSGGRTTPREVWFAHDMDLACSSYSEWFGCPVRFAQPHNELHYDRVDFLAPVSGGNSRVYELATYFIDTQFPSPDAPIRARVRHAIERQLEDNTCSQVEVASSIGMHPRTLQRRLREEGENFESIKDEVRRSAALHYLRHTRTPLKTVAGLLGYSELSVLYRSCHRWFGESPSAVRHIDSTGQLASEDDEFAFGLATEAAIA